MADQVLSPQGERSLAEVVRDMVGNLEQLLRAEVRLAKAEVRDDVRQTVRALRWRAMGAILGLYAIGLALLGAVYLLATIVAPWLAALAVAAGLGLIAAIVATAGPARPRTATELPAHLVGSRLDSRKDTGS
jgi:uncharacterized membrane protein YqjE